MRSLGFIAFCKDSLNRKKLWWIEKYFSWIIQWICSNTMKMLGYQLYESESWYTAIDISYLISIKQLSLTRASLSINGTKQGVGLNCCLYAAPFLGDRHIFRKIDQCLAAAFVCIYHDKKSTPARGSPLNRIKRQNSVASISSINEAISESSN